MSIRESLDMEEEITYQKILSSLLDKSKSLTMKTEIRSPQKLSGLYILSKYLKKKDMVNSGNLLSSYIDIINEYMVSYNRQSRKEIIDAVKSMFESRSTSLSISEKLTSNMAK